MTAARTQAIVAAGLARPELLEIWRRDPSILRDYGVDPRSVDLDRLRKFAGLAFKIRHNPLHIDFPLTFRLLKVTGLEIALFADYAAQRSGSLPTAYAEKAQALVDYIMVWRDDQNTPHALLWDAVRHENALLRLRQTEIANASVDNAPCLVATSVPRVAGALILEEMRSDPGRLVVVLHEPTPNLAGVELATRYTAYWRACTTAGIEMFTLDALGFYLLTLIDGTRTAADLCRQVGGTAKQLPKILRTLRELAGHGIVTLRADECGHANRPGR